MTSARYQRGIVAEAKAGFAKVRFDALDGLLTQWLPVLHPNTQDDKVQWTLDVGSQVACLFDRYMEDGCILGAIYSNVDTPASASTSVWRHSFSDGASVEYDKASGAMSVVAINKVQVTIGGMTMLVNSGGVTVTGGDVVADGISLKTHTHGGVTPGPGNTDTPN